MTRRSLSLNDGEAINDGRYDVEIVSARPYIPEDPSKTAAVYVTFKIIDGPSLGTLTEEVRIGCPTDDQVRAYRDGGKAYRRSMAGLLPAFSEATFAEGAQDDDEIYFSVLTEALIGMTLTVELRHGQGQWSDRLELAKTMPLDDDVF